MARYQYIFPLMPYASEIKHFLAFDVAPYSLINTKRTRNSITSRAVATIELPIPTNIGYQTRHEFSEAANPVGIPFNMASLRNSGGFGTKAIGRLLSPIGAFYEQFFATDTYRRFSNVTELSMVSEARREYVFQYLLVPKSEQESIAVNNVVQTFQKNSYPSLVPGYPERVYPQSLWRIRVRSNSGTFNDQQLSEAWLGDPMPLLLTSAAVEKNDSADSVVRTLPNGDSVFTLLRLSFMEFETGTYDPETNTLKSKSEISADAA